MVLLLAQHDRRAAMRRVMVAWWACGRLDSADGEGDLEQPAARARGSAAPRRCARRADSHSLCRNRSTIRGWGEPQPWRAARLPLHPGKFLMHKGSEFIHA